MENSHVKQIAAPADANGLKHLVPYLTEREINDLLESCHFVTDFGQAILKTVIRTIDPATEKETLEIHLTLPGKKRGHKIR